jgi:hypothetical protein
LNTPSRVRLQTAGCLASTRLGTALSTRRLIESPIDLRDFLDPALPFGMFKVKHLLRGPVKVVGNVGYLLIQMIEGVA